MCSRATLLRSSHSHGKKTGIYTFGCNHYRPRFVLRAVPSGSEQARHTTALKNVMVAIPKNSTSYIFLVLAAARSKVRRVRVLAESCSADRNP
jgi:hypothetical protein